MSKILRVPETGFLNDKPSHNPERFKDLAKDTVVNYLKNMPGLKLPEGSHFKSRRLVKTIQNYSPVHQEN